MSKASGTVYRSDGKARIANATVKASMDKQIINAITDDNGDFVFENLDPGVWKISAMEESSFPSKPQAVDLTNDQADISITLVALIGESDQQAGLSFFWSIIVGLAALIVVYVLLHLWIPQDQSPVSSSLVTLFSQINTQLSVTTDSSKDQVLQSLTTGLADVVTPAIASTTRLSSGDKQVASRLADAITVAVDSGQKDAALKDLASLQSLITNPPVARFQFWGDGALRYLEILLWGLAGILVSKIILVGWYLRSQRFFRQGILMHVSHIVATPLLVLIVVLILSLVTLKVTLAGANDVTIDLADPVITVAFAFVIGTSPWPLWRVIENLARRFTSQVDEGAPATPSPAPNK